MGGIASVFDPLDNWLEGAGDTASSVFREIGHFAESVGQTIGQIGQAAVNDPFGTIAKVAAVATQQYWALPLISAATVVANGGDLGKAALAAGLTYAGMEIASFVGDSLSTFNATGGESLLEGVQHFDDGSSLYQFSDGSTMAYDTAGQVSFVPPPSSSLIQTGSAKWDTAINKAIGNAAGSGSMTLAQTGDFGKALTTGLAGGVGNLAGFGAIEGLKDLGANATLANILGRTAGAATRGLLVGQDIAATVGNALAGNIVNTSLSNFGDSIKNSEWAKGVKTQFTEIWNSAKDNLSSLGTSFSTNMEALRAKEAEISDVVSRGTELKGTVDSFYDDELVPSQQAAEEARNVALAAQTEHQRLVAQFNDIQAKYDEAKANNNADLANQYADEANALIPQVDAAAKTYNDNYQVYMDAARKYESNTDTYDDYVSELTNLSTSYETLTTELNDQAEVVKQTADQYNLAVDDVQEQTDQVLKDTKTAAERIKDYSETAQKAFEDSFSSGNKPLASADFSTDINDSTDIAQSAYEKAREQGGDFTSAYQLSQDVNSLRTDRQGYYEFGSQFGLTAKESYELVDNIEKMSPAAQSAFFDGLRESDNLVAAADAAGKVDELNDSQQNAYYYARSNGLTFDQSLNAAQDVAGLSQQQALAYMNSIYSGTDRDTAMILAGAAALSGEQTAAVDLTDLGAKFKTIEGESLFRNAIAYGYTPEEAMKYAQSWEYQAIGPQFKTEEAYDQYTKFMAEGYPEQMAKAWAQGADDAAIAAGTGTLVADREGWVTVEQAPQDYSLTHPGVKLLNEVTDPATGNVTQTFDDGTTRTLDSEGNQLIKGPDLQEMIDELFKNAPPERKLAKAPTGPGGGTDGGTGPTGTGPTGATGGGTGPTGTGPTGATGGGTGPTGTGPTGGTGGGTGGGAGGTGGTGGGGTGGGTGSTYTPYEQFNMFQQQTGNTGAAGIANLTPGLTKATDYTLTGLPTVNETQSDIQFDAAGGLVTLNGKRKG